MTSRTALVAGIFLAALTAQSPAQVVTGNPTSGRLLVEARCTSCHTVDGAARPDVQAPGFAAIAGMPSTTSLSLRVSAAVPGATETLTLPDEGQAACWRGRQAEGGPLKRRRPGWG